MKQKLTAPQTKFYRLKCRFPLFVGGYGSGKSYMLETCCTRDLLMNPGANLAVYCPTYDLLKLNLIPRIIAMLDQLKLFHIYHKGDHIITVLGFGSIIFRSMDNPDRIIGYEVFRSHCDEIDLLEQKKAELVWNRIIARNRQKVINPEWKHLAARFEGGAKTIKRHVDERGEEYFMQAKRRVNKYSLNRVSAYTTPESFGFTYNRWKRKPVPGYEYVVAPTYSNPHLDHTYIESLRETYTEQMVKAYIEGMWVNLTSGSVYPYFNRETHDTKVVAKPKEPLHIGMDFNVTDMCATVHVIRNGILYCVDELFGLLDTPDMCEVIEERYQRHGHNITIYPDASGSGTSSKSASESDLTLLKKAGFKIKAPSKNPLIKNRVASMNKRFETRKYFVNTDRCPEYTRSLEQQVYDENNGKPKKDGDLDNRNDGAGYLVHTLFPIVRRTVTVETLQGVSYA